MTGNGVYAEMDTRGDTSRAPVHYIEAAIRIEYDPALLPHLLAVARQYVQSAFQVPASEDDDDETVRPMTDEEVAEDVADAQDCILPILEANPLLEQLGLQI